MQERFACPCCGFLTHDVELGHFNVCEVCYWEDCPLQSNDETYVTGPNAVTLKQARENFKDFRVSDPQFAEKVRIPKPEEVPLGREGWGIFEALYHDDH